MVEMTEVPLGVAPRRQETRGRPNTGESGDEVTRRSRRDGGFNSFDIPAHLKKPGWDYQWVTTRVLNEPVDDSKLVEAREGGWREVKPSEMPELVRDQSGNAIEREGQRLFMRPMHLTDAARQEDREIAAELRYNKLAQAMSTPEGEVSRTLQKLDISVPA